jgi:hypothetical protein
MEQIPAVTTRDEGEEKANFTNLLGSDTKPAESNDIEVVGDASVAASGAYLPGAKVPLGKKQFWSVFVG